MAQVKVWNENTHEYTEKFRDREIKIPPKRFVVMDAEEADIFYGTFKPPVKDVDNQMSPKGYKMLRIEKMSGQYESPKAETFNCNVCAYAGSSQEDLDEHGFAFHENQLLDKEAALEQKASKGKGK